MQQYKNTVTTAGGLPIEGATVTVALAAGGAATLYSGNNTGLLGSNVLTTGADGGYVFYAANGRYLLTIAASGFAGSTLDVVLYDPDDPGADPGLQGMWPDVDADTRIHRVRDRAFFGAAAEATGNRSGVQGGLIPYDTLGAAWAIRDGQVVSVAQQGNMAVVGFSRSEDIEPARITSAIGVAGLVIGNNATKTAFGLYSDVQFEAGTYGYGLEIALKNKSGNDETSTPYFLTTGTYGIWMPAGGDDAYGDEATDNNNTALMIGGKRGWTWNKGIVFQSDGLTGCDGVSGLGIAMELGAFQAVRWMTPGNNTAGLIRSTATSASAETSIDMSNNAMIFRGTSNANLFKLIHNSGGVDALQIENSASGAPSLTAFGSSTDIDVTVAPKGAGNVVFPIASVPNYANDAAASAGGVPVGGVYRNGSVLMIRAA